MIGPAERLVDLWSDELCSFDIDYETSYSGDAPATWRVDLKWTSEHENPYGADWATYTWSFYGDTVDLALAVAVAWCEQLLPLERCAGCDGEGWYPMPTVDPGGKTITAVHTTCDDCGGTGLAHNEAAADG